MNKQSNGYIIGYATVMVVIVAVVLSVAALGLKNKQQQNIEIEKKSDILRSVGLLEIPKGADKNQTVVAEYDKYIKDLFLVNEKGEVVASEDPFAVFINLNRQYALPAAERQLPVFVSEKEGARHYIFPVQGSGLWGPIWGYIALDDDLNTVYGAVFAHASETPGLGAEIATSVFQDQFKGKTIFENGTYVGIEVLKGAGASAGNPHAVDAISGGTITSRGVQQMIDDCLAGYKAYIIAQRAQNAPVQQEQILTEENE